MIRRVNPTEFNPIIKSGFVAPPILPAIGMNISMDMWYSCVVQKIATICPRTCTYIQVLTGDENKVQIKP